MKKVLTILGILVLLLVIGGIGGFFYIKKALPNAGPIVDVKITPDSAQIARGEYLANHVVGCIDCHSQRNLEYFGLPRVPGTEGKGGMAFSKALLGTPGDFYARNITPAGIGNWTDAEVFHTVTTGIDKNGEPLFPIMPYKHYGMADPEDIKAVLAYIRTLKPIENKIPADQADFPFSLIMRTIPSEAHPTVRPAEDDTIAYGKYLVNLAACTDCHTPMDKGQPIEGKGFAGGNEYHLPGIGIVRSANITPDKETGIGNWTREQFISQIKFYSDPSKHAIPWKEKGYNTVMPWLEFSGMKESDLAAIWAYLRTLPPVNNRIVKFTPESDIAAK